MNLPFLIGTDVVRPADLAEVVYPFAPPQVSLLGQRVDAIGLEAAVEWLVKAGATGFPRSVCFATVGNILQADRQPEFRKTLQAADLVLPADGTVAWTIRRLGFSSVDPCRKRKLLLAVCRRAAAEGVPVGFCGGASRDIEGTIERLQRHFPELKVVCWMPSPPNDPPGVEDPFAVEQVNASGAAILFVRNSWPEAWIHLHKSRLSATMVAL